MPEQVQKIIDATPDEVRFVLEMQRRRRVLRAMTGLYDRNFPFFYSTLYEFHGGPVPLKTLAGHIGWGPNKLRKLLADLEVIGYVQQDKREGWSATAHMAAMYVEAETSIHYIGLGRQVGFPRWWVDRHIRDLEDYPAKRKVMPTRHVLETVRYQEVQEGFLFKSLLHGKKGDTPSQGT